MARNLVGLVVALIVLYVVYLIVMMIPLPHVFSGIIPLLFGLAALLIIVDFLFGAFSWARPWRGP